MNRRGRFGTISLFQAKKRLTYVAVPEHYLDRAGIPRSASLFTSRTKRGWFGRHDTYRIEIPFIQGSWDKDKYLQALECLSKVALVR